MKSIKRNLPSSLSRLKVYILSDVHIGDANFSETNLQNFINEIYSDKESYVILNGDLINNALPESPSDNFSETLTPDEQIELIIKYLTPIKEKILVIHPGNHEIRTYKKTGIDPTKIIATSLGLRNLYCPEPYILFLGFGKNQGRNNRLTVYAIYGKHGSGGGKTTGSKINKLVSMSDNIDADIYIHSHTHVPCGTKDRFFRVNYKDKRVTPYTRLYVNSSAFLNFGGYGESLGFRPSSLDYPHITLNGDHREATITL